MNRPFTALLVWAYLDDLLHRSSLPYISIIVTLFAVALLLYGEIQGVGGIGPFVAGVAQKSLFRNPFSLLLLLAIVLGFELFARGSGAGGVWLLLLKCLVHTCAIIYVLSAFNEVSEPSTGD